MINNQGGFYPAIAYLGDVRRHGVKVLGPDVNESDAGYGRAIEMEPHEVKLSSINPLSS